jgi:thiamine-monophosphate kinase
VLATIEAMLPPAPPGEVWMGDDSAVVEAGVGRLLLTVDTVVEGVHADLGLVGLDDLGWRAVSTAISDIAAMGGIADHLLVAVSAPPSTDVGGLYKGITAAADLHGAVVVGGDLTTAPQVMVTVAVVGHTKDGGPPVLRSGAAAGDMLFVTGPLGAAAAGLRVLRAFGGDPDLGLEQALDRALKARKGGAVGIKVPAKEIRDRLAAAHRRPVARLIEGEVARSCGATAMIDLSDGFASDVRRIAEASGVGVRLASVPVAEGADEDEAICGGDDYELLFAARDEAAVAEAFGEAGLRSPWIVGECVEDATELTMSGEPLRDCGWEHPF